MSAIENALQRRFSVHIVRTRRRRWRNIGNTLPLARVVFARRRHRRGVDKLLGRSFTATGECMGKNGAKNKAEGKGPNGGKSHLSTRRSGEAARRADRSIGDAARNGRARPAARLAARQPVKTRQIGQNGRHAAHGGARRSTGGVSPPLLSSKHSRFV